MSDTDLDNASFEAIEFWAVSFNITVILYNSFFRLFNSPSEFSSISNE